MSLANVTSAEHYWPSDVPNGHPNDESDAQVAGILDGIREIHQTLFKPPYERIVRTLDQPLLIASREQRPYYLGEFLTVIEGGKGREAETDQLIGKDSNATPDEIVRMEQNWCSGLARH